ncbi:protein indeterminate-domain 5, chloroplastic-like [Canna indica]|uniref:Protein EARLY HEADING DATE 2 n=1 Tax=Canna indica TaxID=4628 RepID=A0AAQ3QAB6_9LILI|nr:protein indeterminate-domain 5, chloroplastic-like [Canna indica]
MMASSSSAHFFGIGEEDEYIHHQQPLLQQQSSTTTPALAATAPQKKKRNLPGKPNPDAEVIALSPKTLLATNRFVCEVCNKGFQREQNLQLHRRGHNLPWKLKQKNPNEVRRRVYLCPEPTCVHHDPSRALGDLTGIKKHYCRKHGEKKWKCEKCSKRYAVQSDWKAHSKICGTREYRCDCGTLFSRRDSFITHRAFCDALAQESARLPPGINVIGGHLYANRTINLGLPPLTSQLPSLQDQAHPSPDLLRLRGNGGGASQFDHLNATAFRQPQPPPFFLGGGGSNHGFNEEPPLLQSKPFHGMMQLQDLQTNANATSPSSAANLFNLGFFSTSSSHNASNAGNQSGHLLGPDQFGTTSGSSEPLRLIAGDLMSNHIDTNMSSLYNPSLSSESLPPPPMSATALLQKAAQMGASSIGNGGGGGSGSGSLLRAMDGAYSGGGAEHVSFGSSFRESSRTHVGNESQFQDIMNSFANSNSGVFNEQVAGYGGFNPAFARMEESKFHRNLGPSDRLTRDFLGVGSMMRSMAGGVLQREQHLGIEMSSMETEMKSSNLSFGGGRLQ